MPLTPPLISSLPLSDPRRQAIEEATAHIEEVAEAIAHLKPLTPAAVRNINLITDVLEMARVALDTLALRVDELAPPLSRAVLDADRAKMISELNAMPMLLWGVK